MSYESRRKKRNYKRAAAKSKRTGQSAGRWYLTVAKKPGRFGCCDRTFKRGERILYRNEPRSIRCEGCGTGNDSPVRRSQRFDRVTRAAA